jgi:ribosomal protein L37E
MWKLRACVRCGGDVLIDRMPDTWYEQCLQCGYQRDLRDIREFEAQPKLKKEPALTRRSRPSKK